MKVLWYGKWHPVDGNHIFMREVTNRLVKKGVETGICYPGTSELNNNSKNPSINYFPLKALWLNQPWSLFSLKASDEFKKILADFEPDIVHLSYGVGSFDLLIPDIIRSLKQKKIKTVASFHFSFGSHIDKYTLFARGNYLFYAPFMRKLDRVIAFGPNQKKWLNNFCFVNNDKISIVANGVDTNLFKPEQSLFRNQFSEKFILGYTGRIAVEKNIEHLIKGFLKAELKDSRLMIVGRGVEKFIKKYQLYKTISFFHPIYDRNKIVDIYRSLDLFVLPSSIEGMSLSLLEALACGVPAIATPAGEHSSIIEKEFILNPDGLEDSVSEKLLWYYQNMDKWNDFKINANKIALQYDWEETVNNIINCYNEVKQ